MRKHPRHGIAEGHGLRVRAPHRQIGERAQGVADVPQHRVDPSRILRILHHETQELLGGIRVPGVLKDVRLTERMELGRPPRRSLRVDGMVHIGGDLGKIVLRRKVDADPVVGQRDLPGEERSVVVGIEPSRHAGNHRLEELPSILQGIDRLGRVERDRRVVRPHGMSAKRPQQPVTPRVGIAHGLSQCKPRGMPPGFEGPAKA